MYITTSFKGTTTIRSNAYLTCNVTAQDVHRASIALLQWERQGYILKNETLLPLIETTKLFSFKFDHISKLLISDLKVSNAGIYSCSAKVNKSNDTPLLLSSETEITEMMLNITSKHHF